MKILCILNVSNTDDLMCDSGVIFQRILAPEFIKNGVHYHVVGPDTDSFRDYDLNFTGKHHARLGVTRYSCRFNFDWHTIKSLIEKVKPDIIFNNQVEITSSIRSILVEMGDEKTKIVTYCHYPALWPTDNDHPELDESLNHKNLGLPIVFKILGALMTSDAFLIQSRFAKNLIDKMAHRHHVNNYKDIITIPPPSDPLLGRKEDNSLIPKERKVLYNHRLYNTYGTGEFLSFMDGCADIPFNLIISDPMPRRSAKRSSLNTTPAFFRETASKLKNTQIVDGNVNRESYKKIISECRLSFGAMRKACVWSMASIDCMSLGIPVLAPNYAAYPEFIPHELLFNNTNEAKQLMKRLLDNDDFWKECSEKAIKTAHNLSPDKIAGQFLDVFKRLC